MRDLDQIIRDMSVRSTNPIGIMDASMFVVGMRKIAEEGAPDTSGMIEGPFTVPLPQAVELIAQMISNEFKTQVYYIFYANMLRGLSHHGIAEEFMEHAAHELEHATYLLRRMSVLSPGGITIPPYPPPEPMSDPQQIIKTMIVTEQMGLVLWKQLHSIMGDNPMKYSIEQFLQREEEHQDELWQHVEAMAMPETPTAETMAPGQGQQPEPAKTQVKVETSAPQPAPQDAEQKVASIFDVAMRRKLAVSDRFVRRAVDNSVKALGDDPSASNVKALKGRLSGMSNRLRKDGTTSRTLRAADAVEQGHEALDRSHRGTLSADRLKQSSSKDGLMASLALATKNNNTSEIEKLRTQLRTEHGMSFDKKASLVDLVRAKSANMMLPSPGADSPEQYVQREQSLGAQQAMAEAAHARTVAMQASQAAQQAQAEAQAAQEQLQQAQQQVEQLSQQTAQESQKSMMATQQAAEAEARAAEHSIAKMQLGMRVNQTRQELANLVMQDPVAESAATVSDLAAQGMPATPMQQMQAEQQAAAAADPNAPQPSAETQQQTQEAQNAQQHAQEQTAEAEQSAKKDESKGGGGTTVSVKTANEMGTVVQRVGNRGAVGETAKAAPGGLSALIAKAKPYAPHIAAGVGGAALLGGGALLARHAHNVGQQQKAAGVVDNAGRVAGRGFVEGATEAVVDKAKKNAPAIGAGLLAAGGLAHAHRTGERSRRREDIAHGVAQGMNAFSKNASPADRRMMQEILGGEQDTLGRSLVDIVKKHAPGQAAQHAAQQAAQQTVAEGVNAAKNTDFSELGQLARRHAPGFGVGLGAGILGTKMMSREQPAPTPAYYVQ